MSAGFKRLIHEESLKPETKWIVRRWHEFACVKLSLWYVPTHSEADLLVAKMDRVYEYYCGRAMGFMLAVKAQVAEKKRLTPEQMVAYVENALDEVKKDVETFAKMSLPDGQLTLLDRPTEEELADKAIIESQNPHTTL
jgi:hypothetical protein